MSDVKSGSLAGRVALVTGATGGLGRAIAVDLGKAGASVALAARSVDKLKEIETELAGLGVSAASFPADLTAVAAIRKMTADVAARFGRLDILVTCAGGNRPKPSLDVEEEDWDLVLDLNLKSLFFCCQAAGRIMIAQRYGRIINMSSQLGHVGLAGRAAYCSSKGGVNQLTKALAVEWATYGVTVNAVSPTVVETDLTRAALADPKWKASVLGRIPMARLARPEEVSAAVTFLASKAAAMITGTSLLVDGGLVAW